MTPIESLIMIMSLIIWRMSKVAESEQCAWPREYTPCQAMIALISSILL